MTRLRLARVFWIGAAAILVAAALVALAAIVRGDFSETDGRIVGTLAAVLLAGGTLVVGLALRERHQSPVLSLVAIVVAPLGFALVAYAIWDFAFDGDDSWEYGWTGAIALVAALMSAGGRLVARAPRVVLLAHASALLTAVAAIVSIVVVWQDDPGSDAVKLVAALWILAALGLLLVPLLQRFTAVPASPADVRVLAHLDDIELVATRTGTGIDFQLAPGERLVLRRRA